MLTYSLFQIHKYHEQEIPNHSNIKFAELSRILTDLGIESLKDILANYKKYKDNAQPQDNTQCPKAPKISKKDAAISWNSQPAGLIWNLWRGIGHQEPLRTSFQGSNFQLLEIGKPIASNLIEQNMPFGSIYFDRAAGHLLVQCMHGESLPIFVVKPANKKEMKAIDFANGLKKTLKTFPQGLHKFEDDPS